MAVLDYPVQLDGVKLFEIKMLMPGRPEEATDEQCAEAALEWANVLREEYGLEALAELPRGIPGNAVACVLGQMLVPLGDYSCPVGSASRQDYVGGGGLYFAREGEVRHMKCPPLVNQFIVRFDYGRYPDLVDRQALSPRPSRA